MTQDVKFEHSKTDDPEDDEYDNDGSINSAVEGDDDIKRDDDYDDDGNDDGNSNNQRLSDHRDSRSQIDLENELVGRTVAARVQTSNSSSTCSLAWRPWPPARPPIITCGGTSETGSWTRYVSFVRRLDRPVIEWT
jgi:hypothetical protein